MFSLPSAEKERQSEIQGKYKTVKKCHFPIMKASRNRTWNDTEQLMEVVILEL